MKRLALALAIVGAATAAAETPRYEAPAPGSYELPVILQLGEHRLLDSRGEPAPVLGVEAGDATIVSFVYLSCTEACPLATATLHQLDRRLARDPALRERVQLVTVSFDPQRDTPQRMADALAGVAPQGRWRFLTARDPAMLEPVLRDFGQDAVWLPGPGGADPDRLRHVLKVFLVDDTGAVRNIYSTGLLDPRLVVADVRTILGLP